MEVNTVKHTKIARLAIVVSLALTILVVPLGVAGCTQQPVSGDAATKLATTMVPPVDLDAYIYVDQQTPTKVPGSLTGAPVDISVQSLAIWGILNSETQYSVGGALTFTSAADAAAVFAQIPKLTGIYTKLSDRVIYFVHGAGGPAESIKNAIDNNTFKKYDDKAALAELSLLPTGSTTRAGIVGIVKPSMAALDLVKRYLGEATAAQIGSVLSDAKTRIIAFGVFGSQPVDVADMARRISNNTVWDMDLGVVVSMDSVYPGFVFSPAATLSIRNQGLPAVDVGGLDAYLYSVKVANGKAVSVYLNVSGNHVFAAASAKDSYARTLLAGINR